MVGIEIEKKVGAKGQVVIPKELRKVAGITPNSKVYIGLEDRKIVIRPKGMSLAEFLQLVPSHKKKKLRIREWDRLYEEELEERWRKVKR